jgi:hypothetical protein
MTTNKLTLVERIDGLFANKEVQTTLYRALFAESVRHAVTHADTTALAQAKRLIGFDAKHKQCPAALRMVDFAPMGRTDKRGLIKARLQVESAITLFDSYYETIVADFDGKAANDEITRLKTAYTTLDGEHATLSDWASKQTELPAFIGAVVGEKLESLSKALTRNNMQQKATAYVIAFNADNATTIPVLTEKQIDGFLSAVNSAVKKFGGVSPI